jgi:hypothetical protein
MNSWFDKGLARARPVGRRRDDATGTVTEASLAEQRDFRGALTEGEGKTTIALRGALSGKSPAAINKMLNTFSNAVDRGGYTGTRINPRSFSAGSSVWDGKVASDNASPNSFSNQTLWFNPSSGGPKSTGRASFGSRSYGNGNYAWSSDQQKLDEANPMFNGPAATGLNPGVPFSSTTPAGTVFTAAAATGAGNKSLVAAGANANAAFTASTGQQVPFLMSTDPFGTQIRPVASNDASLTEFSPGISYRRPQAGLPEIQGILSRAALAIPGNDSGVGVDDDFMTSQIRRSNFPGVGRSL